MIAGSVVAPSGPSPLGGRSGIWADGSRALRGCKCGGATLDNSKILHSVVCALAWALTCDLDPWSLILDPFFALSR